MSPKKDIAKEVDAARARIIEEQLVGFVEEIDGRWPTNDEIAANHIWGRFSKTPLSVYEKSGIEFHDFFVWRRGYALALGFFDGMHPLDLSVVAVPKEKWPTALALYVQQYPPQPGERPAQ
jgi:hypothetical protein